MRAYTHPTPEDFTVLGHAASHDAYRRLYDAWECRMALDEKMVPRATRERLSNEAREETLGKIEDLVSAIRSAARSRSRA